MQNHLAHIYAQFPVVVTDGEGCYLNTTDGRRLLDLYGGHAVASLGYNHPRWVAALHDQAKVLAFQSNAVAVDIREQAAKKLVDFCGLGLDTVFFVNSGAEANENALKLACKFAGRRHMVAVHGSFHGRSAAAGAVTWRAAETWYGFPDKPFDVTFIPLEAAAVDAAITDKTAGVIVEPVQGVGGGVTMPADFMAALRRRTEETGSLLIFDEVQSGMGRMGYPFAANMYGITPDIITTAKALGAGFPVSAMLLSPKVNAKLKLDDMGTTFGGGPMACAMVKAVIEIIEEDGLLANVRARSAQMQERCIVGPVIGTQGAGLLLGFRTKRPAKEVQAELLKHDIVIGTSADPHMLRVLAPFTLTSDHVEQFRDALLKVGS